MFMQRIVVNSFLYVHEFDINTNRGKSQQITANLGKFHSKNNIEHFFLKSQMIASQRAIQKTMAITLEVKF